MYHVTIINIFLDHDENLPSTIDLLQFWTADNRISSETSLVVDLLADQTKTPSRKWSMFAQNPSTLSRFPFFQKSNGCCHRVWCKRIWAILIWIRNTFCNKHNCYCIIKIAVFSSYYLR